ncbi:MAG: carbon-nitrogen hydrolase family protein, partial [bacterium]
MVLDSRRIAGAALQYKMSVVYGTLERAPSGAYNTVVWLEEDQLFRYRKTHIHWTENFSPGSDFPVFRSSLVSAGALVCFDLGFPEAART